MEMEVRGMTAEANQYMYDYACRIIENAAQMHGCTSQIRLMGAATNSLNTPELMDRMKKLCEERYGASAPSCFSILSREGKNNEFCKYA